MKKLFLPLIIVFITIQCFGQTNNDKAMSAYLNAEDAYNKANYSACITNLDNAVALLGKTNIRIQGLLAKAYYGQKNYTQAKAEIKKYFNLNPESDPGYNEMLVISGNIDKKIDEELKARQAEDNENNAYKNAISANTRESYEKYLSDFPSGKGKTEIKNKLEELIWTDATNKNSLDDYNYYVKQYPNGKYKSIAKTNIDNLKRKIALKTNVDSVMADALLMDSYQEIIECIENGADPNKFYFLDKKQTFDLVAIDVYNSQRPFNEYIDYLKTIFKLGADPNLLSGNYGCFKSYYISEELQHVMDVQERITVFNVFMEYGFKKENLSNESFNILTQYVTSDNK